MQTRRTASGERLGTEWTRVTRSVARRRDVPDLRAAQLTAWSQVMGGDAEFTHVTAAGLLGLWMPRLPAVFEAAGAVVIQTPVDGRRVRRPGMRVLRSDAVLEPITVRGVRCASVPDVLLGLARDLSDLDLLVAVDSALYAGLTSPDEMERVSGMRRRGAPALRRVLARADGRSESPWETILREFHRQVGASVTPQFEVRDESGGFVARGDLRLDGCRVLHEYDGHHHLEVGRQRADLRRSRRLEAAGWVRRGYAAPDLVARPHEVLADVDRSLGREVIPGRLDGWRASLRASTFTSPGRRAFEARLDWTQ